MVAGARFGLWKRPLAFEFLLDYQIGQPAVFEPVFESRSRFRQVSYAVTDPQHPATSTRLKHAAESSLKHPEHDHVKRGARRTLTRPTKITKQFPDGRRRGRRAGVVSTRAAANRPDHSPP